MASVFRYLLHPETNRPWGGPESDKGLWSIIYCAFDADTACASAGIATARDEKTRNAMLDGLRQRMTTLCRIYPVSRETNFEEQVVFLNKVALVRRVLGADANDVLRSRLSSLQGKERLPFLVALAEEGDVPCQRELSSLDASLRKAATRLAPIWRVGIRPLGRVEVEMEPKPGKARESGEEPDKPRRDADR